MERHHLDTGSDSQLVYLVMQRHFCVFRIPGLAVLCWKCVGTFGNFPPDIPYHFCNSQFFLESSDASPSAPIMFMYNLCFIIAKGARICLRALMFKEHIIPYVAAAFLFTLSETCTCVP